MRPGQVTQSALFTMPQASNRDLVDLLLWVLLPDGSTRFSEEI